VPSENLESYVNSHNVSLFRCLGLAVHTGTTIGAEIMGDFLGRKAVFLKLLLVPLAMFDIVTYSADLDCVVGVMESDICYLRVDHHITVNVADRA